MTKNITVIIDKKGIHVDFNGFQGSTCYQEHEKLTLLLAKLGIQEEIENMQSKEETNTEVKEHAEVKS